MSVFVSSVGSANSACFLLQACSKRELGNQLHQARRFKSAAVQYNKVRGCSRNSHTRLRQLSYPSLIFKTIISQGLTALVGFTAGDAEGANEHSIILPLRLNLTACVSRPLFQYSPLGVSHIDLSYHRFVSGFHVLVCLFRCYLKLGDWNSALEHSEQVLALQPCNVKALYRRAQAHVGRLEFDEARACLLRAQRALDEAAASGDQNGADERQKMRAEIAAELRKVGGELKRSEMQQRRHYAGMFDRMAAEDKSAAADRDGAASGWSSCWWRVRRFFAAWTGRSVDATGKRD